MDTREKLASRTVALHWIVALLMIFMTLLGMFLEELDNRFLFDTHTSFGWVILIVVLPRVLWRMKNGWPQAAGDYTSLEHLGSKVMHWVLILATLLMPVSGILMSVAGGHGLALYGLEVIAESHDPNNPGEALALSPLLAELGSSIHHLLGDILIYAIALHAIGAFKHHIIDKDETLRRMMGLKPR